MKDKIIEAAKNMPWEQMVQDTRANSITTLYVGIAAIVIAVAIIIYSFCEKDEENQFLARIESIIPFLIGIALILIQVNILNNPEYHLYTQIMNVIK